MFFYECTLSLSKIYIELQFLKARAKSLLGQIILNKKKLSIDLWETTFY